MTRSGRSGALEAFYRSYLALCNAHRFEELLMFLRPDVRINGETKGAAEYIAGLEDVVRAFPDYTWDLQHLLVDEPWICAHLLGSGTHRGLFLGVAATGREVSTQEFAVYRVEEQLIAEVWVTADNLTLLRQLS